MTREDLTLALAAALAIATIAGWALHALWTRMRHGGAAGLASHDEMAVRLHDAEEAADVARTNLSQGLAHIQAERAETEEALRRELTQREAELIAAMDSIGELRRDLADWRNAYDAAIANRPDA
ncbi:MAG: hypothetical protein ACJAVR_002190 [Paracoccaceae bacterium]|jgi:hypothetical protein